MSSFIAKVLGSPATDHQLPFKPTSYTLRASDGTDHDKEAGWKVRVSSQGHLITRQVWRNEVPWEQCGEKWEPETTIWPTWPSQPEDEAAASASPLSGVEDYWSTAGNRLRESAKWMATVLGAALATLIGTSPLAGISGHRHQEIAVIFGAVGLVLLGITLILVLQVMRPRSVSYTDVQEAKRRPWGTSPPLYKWRDTVQSQHDLYLPSGVDTLLSLRQSMIVEEATLRALARATASARDREASGKISEAQSARGARLLEVRTSAAQVATVGEYYKLRTRSSWATFGGVVSGLLGAAGIIAFFAWPAT
jgi:hypothetical protein